MLDEKKVRLMARTALYEQSFGSGTIKFNKQFEKGAGAAAFFQHVPAGVITFLLAAILAAAFGQEWIIRLYRNLGLAVCLLVVVLALLFFVFAYCLYARFMLRKQYEEKKGEFWKYHFMEEKLFLLEKKKSSDEKKAGGAKA